MSDSPPKVYNLQVSNISCTNCASNIKTILSQGLKDSETKISVNVMSQRVSISTNTPQIVTKVVSILQTTKYKPVASPVLISGNADNNRTITFIISQEVDLDKLQQQIQRINGIVSKHLTSDSEFFFLNLTYDSATIKGRDIADIVQNYDDHFKIKNQRIDSLRATKKQSITVISIRKTVLLVVYFMLANMIFPMLPYIESFYQECITFPRSFGIYSFSVLFNILFTLYVMNYYAKTYIKRAYRSYKEFGTTNMETLVALGSISALSLAFFFILRYTFESLSDSLTHIHMAIMDINHSLTSASIIVLVVTLGKHLEMRVKQNIAKQADEIFPESVLFSDMNIDFVQVRNRKLTILKEKQYDVSLVEENDVIRLKPGKLLIDVIIVSGQTKATQSARTGSDQATALGKGERIESGSTIHEVDNCLAIVERVIEKSLLIEVITHVKFSQNEEESQASAIEVLCRKIANYFVKGVIILSLTTMTVWTLLLNFNLTEVPVCNACWVIQRGIGVLVASCPCALGLAIPSVVANILNLAIKSGILIKKTSVFQKIKNTKMMVFDKTGTLFTKINQIQNYQVSQSSLSQEQRWQILALLERDIRHPLAEIIFKQAIHLSKIPGTNFSFIVVSKQFIPGQGIKATIVNKADQKQLKILIGNKYLLSSHGVIQNQLSKQSSSIFLAIDGHPQMAIQFNTHSNLRPETVQVIRKIQLEGIQVHILSGDSQSSVQHLGQNIQLSQKYLHSQKTAIQKLQWVKLQQQNHPNSVIMVGDGLNDIPCLQQAGIGISINAKSQMNINAADVIILSENLQKILALIRFLRKGNLFIRLNLLWAFAYNIIMMPVVAGVLFEWGIMVSPMWSAIAMSCSSLLVVGFSHLLTLFHYDDSLQSIPSASDRMQTTLDLSGSNRQVITLNEQIS